MEDDFSSAWETEAELLWPTSSACEGEELLLGEDPLLCPAFTPSSVSETSVHNYRVFFMNFRYLKNSLYEEYTF